MAKIKTRYSTAAGATLPVGLTTGELAVNIVQRRVFVGGTAGTVELAGLSANTFTGLQSIQTASTTVPPLVITNTSSGDEFRFRPSNGTIQFYDASSTNVQSLEFSATPFGTHTISLPNASTVLAGVCVQQTFLASNTFNQVTNFVDGISASGGITLNGNINGSTATFNRLVSAGAGISANGATLSGVVTAPTPPIGTNDTTVATTAFVNNEIVADAVTSFNGLTGARQGVSAAVAGTGIQVSGATGSVTITNIGVQSFNGLTGVLQGVSAAVAGTGIQVSGATGSVTITNIGVQSFNGRTGAVTGASLGANTFTELNTFNAGISANGATLSGTVTAPTQTVGTNNTTVATTAFVIANALTSSSAVTGVNGFTGAVGISGGQGITLDKFGVNVKVIRPTINYNYGGLTFPTYSLPQTIGGGAGLIVKDWMLLQANPSNPFVTTAEEMYLTTIGSFKQWIFGGALGAVTGFTGTEFIPILTEVSGATTNSAYVGITAFQKIILDGGVTSFNGRTGAVQGVSAAVAGDGISVSGATGAVTITNAGVTRAVAGTGISVTANTGTVSISNTGVLSFNGNAGAVTGASLGANTFTGLQTSATGFSGPLTGTATNASSLGGVAAASYALLASPAFTGTPTSTTAAIGTNTTQIATTAFVNSEIIADAVTSFNGRTGSVQGVSAAVAGDGISVSGATGAVTITNAGVTRAVAGTGISVTANTGTVSISNTGVLSFNGNAGAVTGASLGANTFTGLQTSSTGFSGPLTGTATNASSLGNTAAASWALLASPTFTGTPAAPTATSGTNTTQIATTQFVRTEITNLVNSAPAALDTLNELATALGNDPNFSTTITTALGNKAGTTGGNASGTWGISITGNAATATNSTQLGGTAAASWALLNSPTLTGTPAAPTAAVGTNTTQIATTAFVNSEIIADAVTSFNGRTGSVQGVSAAVAGDGISVSGATGAVTITNAGVTRAVAGTGIAVTANTGTVSISNTGVLSFNGNAGAVTGASLGANTFTGLQVFNAGVCSAGGTFANRIDAGTTTMYLFDGVAKTIFFGTGTADNIILGSGAATSSLQINQRTILLANAGSGDVTFSTSGRGIVLEPVVDPVIGGSTPKLTVEAIDNGGGFVKVDGGNLYIGRVTEQTPAARTLAGGIVFEGSGSDNLETTLTVQEPTADREISLPNDSGVLALTKGVVTSFNGLTGAVTGASLGANTFTALNTFNAGIKSNIYEPLTGGGGITFGLLSGGGQGNIHFLASEIRVGGTSTLQGITLTTVTGVTLTVRPRHNLIVSPFGGSVTITSQLSGAGTGGSIPRIVLQNTDTGGGQVQIDGGDLYLGIRSNSVVESSSNIIFGNPTNAFTTTLTAPNTATSSKIITLPNTTGTVALDANANIFTALQSFTAGISASGGITFANALSVAGNLNSTGLLNSTGGISAAGGITFNANINLQNAEFIRNTTNGRMDFMPSPSGSGNYGLYTDFTSWGFGARLGTIRSSDQALNVGAVLFDTDCVLLGSRFFAMEPGQTIKFLASGPDSNNNNTLQCTLNMSAGKTGNAFVLMDMTATGYGSTRVPSVSFTNPNFFIYSGTATRVNANDFVRFEHNITDGRIVSGGTSGISIEPGSGTVGISGGVSAGAYILNSSGIKALTGTTYTFIATDNGRVLTHDNASGCTVTIPTGLPVGFSTTVIRLNATGRVGFTAASGVTMNTYNGWTGMAGQHASASVVSYATNIFNLSGTLA